MASSSSSSSSYGSIRPRVAGSTIYHAMKLPKATEMQAFERVEPYNERHINVGSFRGQTDCDYALDVCERQRLHYMLNPGPQTQIHRQLLPAFYSTLRMHRPVGPWIEEQAEWDNFRSFTFSVKIGRRRFEFTTDHVTAAYKNITVDEATAESADYAQLPIDNTYLDEAYPHFRIDTARPRARRRVHLAAHMWLVDSFVRFNLHPVGHERERTEFFGVILWWLSQGYLVDVGSIVLKLMFYEREGLFGPPSGRSHVYCFPRLIDTLMTGLGWVPAGDDYIPLPIEPFRYANFTRSYNNNKRQLARWLQAQEEQEAQAEQGDGADMEQDAAAAQALAPVDPDVEFRRRVLDYLEVISDRTALMRAEQEAMRAEHTAMRADQTRLAQTVDILGQRFDAMAQFFPPPQPPPQ